MATSHPFLKGADILRVSEVDTNKLADYLRLDEGEYTDTELEIILSAATAYIRSYTGLDDIQIEEHEDFTIALMVLCQDMYENKSMYVERNNVNKVVETILGMHCINLL